MAIIIETCPKCEHDLQDLIITTYPPIPQKKCFNCGWEWTGKPEEVIRMPFCGNSFEQESTYLNLNCVDINSSTIIGIDLCNAELKDMSILNLKQGF